MNIKLLVTLILFFISFNAQAEVDQKTKDFIISKISIPKEDIQKLLYDTAPNKQEKERVKNCYLVWDGIDLKDLSAVFNKEKISDKKINKIKQAEYVCPLSVIQLAALKMISFDEKQLIKLLEEN